jgi:hypothetical protein
MADTPRARPRSLAPRQRAWLVAAGFAALALLAGLLVAGVHDAYPTTRVPQEVGLAWVPSDQIGSLTLLDGVAGQPVINVKVAHAAGDRLLAAQTGTTGFALDSVTGQVTRIDGSSYLALTAQNPVTGTGAALQLLAGTQSVYTVDADQSSVSVYDAATLQHTADSLALAQAPANYTAVTDSAGNLWVLDQDSGQLTWFAGTAVNRSVQTFTSGAATLVLADGEPVVIDGVTRRAYLIGPDGSVQAELALGPDAGSGWGFAGAAAQQALLVTDSARDAYQTCTFTLGSCGQVVHAGFDGDTLGPAVAADGRVFIPDYTADRVWVLNPSGATQPVHTGRLTSPGSFDLFERNGLIFYNDPNTNQAGTIAPDGTPTPIVKYSPAAPVRTRSPSPAADASASRTPSTTTGAPPTSSPSPTPSSPSPVPSSPSPHPHPSGSSTVSCGQTITKSIILTADLHCTGNGLTIGANNVIIDLGQHTISGDGTGTAITIEGATGTDIVVKPVLENGTVSGFGTGLAIGPSGAKSVEISAVRFENDARNGAAIDLGSAPVFGLQIDEITVSQASGWSVLGAGQAGVLAGMIRISGSTFDGGGIYFYPSSSDNSPRSLFVTDNQFSRSRIELQTVGSTTFSGNIFKNSPVTDMCQHQGNDTFTSNTFEGPVFALTISAMTDETIAGNRFEDNLVGVELSIADGDVGDTIENNAFIRENDVGILVNDNAASPTAVMIQGNTAVRDGWDPTGVRDSGKNPAIGGIHIYAPEGATVVIGNHTGPDRGYGIWSISGTATGTGNISFHDQHGCAPKALCVYT